MSIGLSGNIQRLFKSNEEYRTRLIKQRTIFRDFVHDQELERPIKKQLRTDGGGGHREPDKAFGNEEGGGATG